MISLNRILFQLFRTVVICCSFFSIAESQQHTLSIPSYHSRSLFHLSHWDTLFVLSTEFVIAGSETVWLDSSKILRNHVDYSIDYRLGRLRLAKSTRESIVSDSLPHSLLVAFRSLPLAFKAEYFLHQTTLKTDSLTKSRIAIVTPAEIPPFEDLFGPGIQKSGSIARGFTVGTNRDLSLTSGFRMQLAGNLSRDVGITAALTDENTPIQPEGTTQSLREVDNVFVQLKSPRYSATLGDFNLDMRGEESGEFMKLSRKLQGATGTFHLFGRSDGSPGTSVALTGATQRGKYNTIQFQGVEGNQGPYQLNGKNGERRIVVVAGSACRLRPLLRPSTR